MAHPFHTGRDDTRALVFLLGLCTLLAGCELTRANERLQGDIVWRQAAEKQRDSMEIQLRHAQKLESIGQLAAGTFRA